MYNFKNENYLESEKETKYLTKSKKSFIIYVQYVPCIKFILPN